MTFKNVEDALEIFSGDGSNNVHRWIRASSQNSTALQIAFRFTQKFSQINKEKSSLMKSTILFLDSGWSRNKTDTTNENKEFCWNNLSNCFDSSLKTDGSDSSKDNELIPQKWRQFRQKRTPLIWLLRELELENNCRKCKILESQCVKEIISVITNSSTEGKNKTLKAKLIIQLSTSQEKKIKQLLKHREMENRTDLILKAMSCKS
ncbi:hypothetical protein HZH66_011450 [Vespula vulgaris]|uniref:Uncharacterized protein n=1 Tax=Vespula vulgaris TaxID=7454 RepID=A0A834JE87_VESVU|nr:hypothetical protein HZH66_011450 [Vespula vulgaris]